MIEVSEIARMVILETLQTSGAGPNKGLRLKQEDKGVTLHVDVPKNDDQVTWHNKSIVLIVDQDTEGKIGNAVVDVEEGTEEARLVLRHKISKSQEKTL